MIYIFQVKPKNLDEQWLNGIKLLEFNYFYEFNKKTYISCSWGLCNYQNHYMKIKSEIFYYEKITTQKLYRFFFKSNR